MNFSEWDIAAGDIY